MTKLLEQKESIALLEEIQIIPQKAYAKILEENGMKFVLRQYKIKELEDGYNVINISYALNIDSDLITYYSVYVTSDKADDIICLCTFTNNVYNTLFDSILSLEEDVWKHQIAGEDISTPVNNFKSLIFEVDDCSYPFLAEAIYERNVFNALLARYLECVNENQVIAKKSWKTFLNDLTKLSIIWYNMYNEKEGIKWVMEE